MRQHTVEHRTCRNGDFYVQGPNNYFKFLSQCDPTQRQEW